VISVGGADGEDAVHCAPKMGVWVGRGFKKASPTWEAKFRRQMPSWDAALGT
jgi:hypothetical protein